MSALLPVAVAVLVGLALVYLLFARQRSDYKKHVDQLQPKKKKNAWVKPEPQLFTRAEVAKHQSRDDAWVIIKHK